MGGHTKGDGVSGEGEGMFMSYEDELRLNVCPDHGNEFVACVLQGIGIHLHCNVEGCKWTAIRNNLRRQCKKIEHEDRRKNEY